MSNYSVTANFSAKDNLNTGNPSKVVKGTELQTEFDNIETAIATKSETEIPSGTKMVFIETGAPTGWTINNSYDDQSILLRTSANITDDDVPDTAGNWTISNTELSVAGTTPNHTHGSGNLNTGNPDTGTNYSLSPVGGNNVVSASHQHSINGNTDNPNTLPTINSNPANGTMVNGNWRPAHVEAIICSKD